MRWLRQARDRRAGAVGLLGGCFGKAGLWGRVRALFLVVPFVLCLWVVLAPVGRAEAEASEDPQLRAYCSEHESLWRRSRTDGVAGYCNHAALARAGLKSDPARAYFQAKKALALLGDGLEAHCLLAESTLLQGDAARAHRLFLGVLSRIGKDEARQLPFATTVTIARAALLSADYASAMLWYRRVVLGLDRVHGPRQRARLLIEAATAASYHEPPWGNEARSYLRLASAQNAPLLREVLLGAWVVSWLRDAKDEQARARARELGSSWAVSYVFSAHAPSVGASIEILPVLPAGEGAAMALGVASLIEPDVKSLHFERFSELVSGSPVPAHILAAAKQWEHSP